MAERKQRNVESKLLYTVLKTESQDGARSIVIRVVDWIAEGKHYPQLEKREFYSDDNGEWKMGKAKGFTRKDLLLVQDKWGEIMDALGSKVPEDKRGPAPAQQQDKPAPAAASAPADDF